MCDSSYQRKHVSMDEGNEVSHQVGHSRRWLLLLAGVLTMVVSVAACFLYAHQNRSGREGDAITEGIGDDYFIMHADDDSVLYNGEPEVEDEETIALNNLGAENIEKLSKETSKSKNITSGCETTILLMRHCEKGGGGTIDSVGNEHCDYLGYERTYWIPSLFGPNARWPIPSYLYALSPTRESHLTLREVETLTPLSEKFGLVIQQNWGTNNEVVKDIFKVMSTGGACGKLIVVNWRHHMIPNLAKKMGCNTCPSEYPEYSFDQVWQLKFVWDVENTEVYRKSNREVQPQPKLRRELKTKTQSETKKTKKRKQARNGPFWSVYSTITYQNFDPLQFSGSVGDYDQNRESTETRARWLSFDEGEM